MHAPWPVAPWNCPLGQSWQTSPTLKRPGSHFVQNVCPPTGWMDPSGHGVQLARFFSVEIVCGAQFSHSAEIELTKVPGVHGLQYPALEPPQPTRAPAAHGSEAHSAHAPWPVALWKRPLGQTWQMPPVANVPVAHGLQ